MADTPVSPTHPLTISVRREAELPEQRKLHSSPLRATHLDLQRTQSIFLQPLQSSLHASHYTTATPTEHLSNQSSSIPHPVRPRAIHVHIHARTHRFHHHLTSTKTNHNGRHKRRPEHTLLRPLQRGSNPSPARRCPGTSIPEREDCAVSAGRDEDCYEGPVSDYTAQWLLVEEDMDIRSNLFNSGLPIRSRCWGNS